MSAEHPRTLVAARPFADRDERIRIDRIRW